MTFVFYTKRFVFKCEEERQRMSCIKFGSDGQFFRAIGIARIGGKYYVVDDTNTEFRSNCTLLGATKQYIEQKYGKIVNVVKYD